LEPAAGAVVPLAVHLPVVCCERQGNVAQRSIEILIGRLITDEAFRYAFRTNALAALAAFIESGYELTHVEIDAVRATPTALWDGIAEHIDPRLQKMSFSER
jgi:hypothetical protein